MIWWIWVCDGFGGPKAMNEWRNEMDERFHLPRQHFQLFFSFGLGLWACCGLWAQAAPRQLAQREANQPKQTKGKEETAPINQLHSMKRKETFIFNWIDELIWLNKWEWSGGKSKTKSIMNEMNNWWSGWLAAERNVFGGEVRCPHRCKPIAERLLGPRQTIPRKDKFYLFFVWLALTRLSLSLLCFRGPTQKAKKENAA